MNEYEKIFREQLEAGVIERVPNTDDDDQDGDYVERVNYLPHHAPRNSQR